MENSEQKEPQYSFGAFDQWRARYFASIFGAPFEHKPSFRPGTSQAPKAIRLASQNIETYSFHERIALDDLGIRDLGDISVAGRNPLAYLAKLEEAVRKAQRDQTIPVLIGGEHTITLSNIKTFSNSLFIVLDAHADLRDEWLGSKYSHACVFRRFLEETPSNHLIQLGVRAMCKEEAKYAKKASIRQISPLEFFKKGPKGVAGELLDCTSSFDSVYISVDMDCFDPAFAPGVATPEAIGLTPLDFLAIISELETPILGLDVVETVPSIDPAGITAVLAARIIFEIMAHEARRRSLFGD
ncbi:MAG: agmatinase [Candidatus Hodarchaeales archaeon]|jgi:agmatinase